MAISFDLETNPIADGQHAPRIVCGAFADAQRREMLLDREGTLSWIRHWALCNPPEALVGHNIAFDMACLCAADPALVAPIFAAYEAGRIHCTQVRGKLLDIAKGCYRAFYRLPDGSQAKYSYSLKALAKRFCGIELAKGEDTWRLRYGELDGTPIDEWPEEARTYPLGDVRAALALYQKQEEFRFEDGRDLFADAERQTRHAFWLQLMACWGLTTDLAAVAKFAKSKRAERDELVKTLTEAGLARVDKKGVPRRNVKVARERLRGAYEASGRVVPISNPDAEKPQVATDAAACEKSRDPLLSAFGRLSKVSKVLSTDVPLLEKGIIHAHFEELLETGRTSSSPNVQNLPRGYVRNPDTGKMEHRPGVRECFVPRPGYVYAAADFASLELHTFAQVCLKWFGHSKLAEALNTGLDCHTVLASQYLGITYEEGMALKAAEDAAFANTRTMAKSANYGFLGGLGPDRFVHFAANSYDLEVTRTQATKLKAAFLAAWPEARRYFERIGEIVKRPRPMIEHLFSGRWRSKFSFTEGANALFQGLGADAAKAAGWAVSKACYVGPSVLYGSRIVNFVHDELILEVPEAIGHEAAHELQRLMAEAARPWTPDVPVQVGEPVLMRRWSKKARQVWKDGRLVPWDGPAL